MKQFFLITVSVFIISLPAMAADDFPLRKDFPNVTPISVADAFKNFDKELIVDVRTKFEYDVVHIVKAIHIPMNNKSLFLEKLQGLRSKDDIKPIVLYCNGVRCKKSYEASTYTAEAGFKNITVLDAGVIAWLKAHPDKSFLLGKTPADPSKIISEDRFKGKMVEFAAFKAATSNPDAVVFDVRDATQQAKKVDLPNVKHMQLDNILPLLQKGVFKDKELYVMDAVGKQVEWLQYYLEEYGYKYHFLKGGTDSL